MKSIKEKLNGVISPIVTPFVDQEVDYKMLGENIIKWNNTKLKGYMPLGSNGEFKSLTDEEAIKVVEVVIKNKSKDKTLIVGAGRESAKATIEFIKKVNDIGEIDFVSILTPNYFPTKMNDEALIKFYTTVADNSPVPIMIYNIPKSANGVMISSRAISELAQHRNIVGIKDTSKEDIGNYVKAVPDGSNFYVLSGSITKFLDGLQKGAIGGVLSMANYLPDLCCKIQELYNQGNYIEAEKLSSRLCKLNSKISGAGGVVAVKAAMNLLGYNGMEPRIPLLPLKDNEIEEIKKALQEEGLIE
ncbi:dihydrodipicolinate synthase family protein [Thermoanaerobacterium thermosaccharolyticum]|uniref:Dihydrodipicolinate synthase/N-acetylneuraminate lyase n=1 Tax=Thermoanaerobacterium thermosaccharolyticum M0795 TaxID=698948 RepID=L0IP09_THETR|nr:dihydrodipicolinate synthase family protein [Thermoanaerobacterium thermosaccharolyticum]AGB19722.1 dihydrodipicolinate synthase/N-acetylneuraminate lyase [Thermoanaerobacterium thermosaccharolyticum M0795]